MKAALLILFACLSVPAQSPTPNVGVEGNGNATYPPEERGTCAIAGVGRGGMAFAVDSRSTQVDTTGKVLGHMSACKVRNPRADVLIVAVNIADTGGPDHWVALDKATDLIYELPLLLDRSTLRTWSVRWRDSLSTWYRSHGTMPKEGLVSEMLLLTRERDRPVVMRSTIMRRGENFDVLNTTVDYTAFKGPGANAFFSGYCRQMITSVPFGGEPQPPTVAIQADETALLDEAWASLHRSTHTDSLADSLLRFEEQFTKIDQRINGDASWIGPPYAVAEWPNGTSRWQLHLNPECAPHPQTDSGGK